MADGSKSREQGSGSVELSKREELGEFRISLTSDLWTLISGFLGGRRSVVGGRS